MAATGSVAPTHAFPTLSEAEHRAQLRRAVIAGTIGTTIEWYDFFLYSTVTGLVFAKLYFPQSDRLVGTLMACSPEFRYFWQRHEVSGYTPINKRIRHPTAGRMVFEYNSFTADDQSGAKLVVYTPLGEEHTQQKMKELLHGSSH